MRTTFTKMVQWFIAFACFVLTLSSTAFGQVNSESASPQQSPPLTDSNTNLRVMSWNVSGNSFVNHPTTFKALVQRSKANILILDEVSPLTAPEQIRAALPELEPQVNNNWHIDFGISGGRQRGVIVSRLPLEQLPEFTQIIHYPESERRKIHQGMEDANELQPANTMDDGIALNGAVIIDGKRRLLVVSIDLQCCGNDPSSWQEYRRRVETRELRKRIVRVLARTRIDGIIVAGDFNLVSTALPLVITAGPYSSPHNGLIVAELRQLDGEDMWTWDGRGTAFPSNTLDFQLYSPNSLELQDGYILSSDDLSLEEIDELSIHTQSSRQLSDHLPLVTTLIWH